MIEYEPLLLKSAAVPSDEEHNNKPSVHDSVVPVFSVNFAFKIKMTGDNAKYGKRQRRVNWLQKNRISNNCSLKLPQVSFQSP